MELDTQKLINELLEQNKQLNLQISIARVMVAQLQGEIEKLTGKPFGETVGAPTPAPASDAE